MKHRTRIHAPMLVCGSIAAQTHNMASKRKRDENGDGSDDEDFNFMHEDARHKMTSKLPTEDTDHPSDAKLRNHRKLHRKVAHAKDKPNLRIRIWFEETKLTEAQAFLQKYERWYTRYQLEKNTGSNGPDVKEWERRLFADPLGLTPVPKTDTRCWQTKKIDGRTTFVETDFHRGLKMYHEGDGCVGVVVCVVSQYWVVSEVEVAVKFQGGCPVEAVVVGCGGEVVVVAVPCCAVVVGGRTRVWGGWRMVAFTAVGGVGGVVSFAVS